MQEFLCTKQHNSAVYLCPKQILSYAPKGDGIYSFSYESLVERETWLNINAMVDTDTAMIIDCPSRYPKITSEKTKMIQRLSMRLKKKAVTDIVPFTLDIEYLYTPWSFLGRSILGFQHYYAFRENYEEIDDDGNIVSAHDHRNLSRKIKPYVHIEYDAFLQPDRKLIECPATEEEHGAYAKKKAELFKKYNTPQPIVTRLADFTHAMQSRTDRLLDLLTSDDCNGETVVFCNLASYAKRAHAAVKKTGRSNVTVTSYQAHYQRLSDVANCIYFESPIVKCYLLQDVEALLPNGCRVFHFRSDNKVDLYLYDQMMNELSQIDGFTRVLAQEVSV